MAKAEAAPAKMTVGQLSGMRLKAIDAMFFLMFGIIAIGLVLGFELR